MTNEGECMDEMDKWHYPRTQLAQAIMNTLSSNVVHAITLFAPRRMGKTEFLRKDITPQAKAQGFHVFYFSFLDGANDTVISYFATALKQFIYDNSIKKRGASVIQSIKKIGALGATLEVENKAKEHGISELMMQLSKLNKPVLLLLDEIQEIANIPNADGFVASLRTGLDLGRDTIKTIFTGSSRNGLIAMFDNARAPFFHFSTSVDFPTLDDGFVEHLANMYEQITKQHIDRVELQNAFNEIERVPMHARTLIKELIIDPVHDLEKALSTVKKQLRNPQTHDATWGAISGLERAIILYLLKGGKEPYSQTALQQFSNSIGVDTLQTYSVQNAIRKLSRNNHITKNAHGEYVINEPDFVAWLKDQCPRV